MNTEPRELHELYGSIQQLAEELLDRIDSAGFDETVEAGLERLNELVRQSAPLAGEAKEAKHAAGLEQARTAARGALAAFETLMEQTRQHISRLQSERSAIARLRNSALSAPPTAGTRRVLADA